MTGSNPVPPTSMDLNILHENATLLVVDKPAGIPVWQEEPYQGTTLAQELAQLRPELQDLNRHGIVHRLDKDTSGVLLVAKTPDALEYFQRQFKEHSVQKTYQCLVTGSPGKDAGEIRTFIGRAPSDRRKQKAFPQEGPGRREAITEFRVLERFPGFALLKVVPKTGRKHQIRAHMTYLGHPLAGDKLYSFKNQQVPEGLGRHFLHAYSLEVQMEDGSREEFISPLPEDLQSVLEILQKKSHGNSN
ncbi:MAG: RNA pseudouridine synthase [Candidatus Yanofskybacteria bacterium]|nr:RNA pseudouridine synthase [Candidatus Yanofskybacteria bacterium]